MSNSLKDYQDLVREWIAIRNANHGLFSDDELPIMDAITDVWAELNDLDRKRAELLVQQVPTASKHTVILDSDLMLPRRNHADPLARVRDNHVDANRAAQAECQDLRRQLGEERARVDDLHGRFDRLADLLDSVTFDNADVAQQVMLCFPEAKCQRMRPDSGEEGTRHEIP